MGIEGRIASAETIAAAALIPWLARSKALAKSYTGGGVAGAAAALGAPPEIVARIRSAVNADAMSDQPGLAGSSTSVTSFIRQASETSVLLRAISDGSVINAPMKTWLVSSASAATADEVGEGEAIALQGLSLRRDRLEPFKLAALVVTTSELWNSTSAAGQAYLGHLLRAAIAEAADRSMFARLTDSGTVDLDLDATTDALVTGVQQMLAAVHSQAMSRRYWGLSPSAWNWLAAAPGLPDDYRPIDGKILGSPAVVTDALDGRRIALIDGKSVGASIERLEIRESGDATIEMADDPSGDAITPTATNQVALFQTSGHAVRVVMHMAVQPVRADAAAFATIAES